MRMLLPLTCVVALSIPWATAVAQPATDIATTTLTDFQVEYLRLLDQLEARLLQFAKELPDELYGKSLVQESRTIGDTLTNGIGIGHQALLDMNRLKKKDIPPPPESPAEIAQALERSLSELRRAVEGLSATDLELPVDHMGRRWTIRELLVSLLVHRSEGLGYAAAVAEGLGYPPPWVRERRESKKHDD